MLPAPATSRWSPRPGEGRRGRRGTGSVVRPSQTRTPKAASGGLAARCSSARVSFDTSAAPANSSKTERPAMQTLRRMVPHRREASSNAASSSSSTTSLGRRSRSTSAQFVEVVVVDIVTMSPWSSHRAGSLGRRPAALVDVVDRIEQQKVCKIRVFHQLWLGERGRVERKPLGILARRSQRCRGRYESLVDEPLEVGRNHSLNLTGLESVSHKSLDQLSRRESERHVAQELAAEPSRAEVVAALEIDQNGLAVDDLHGD